MSAAPPPVPELPSFPSGYGIATDLAEQGAEVWERARAQLEAARNYWICTTRPDGRPHAAPVWGLWLDDAVVFSTDPGSVKGRNLAARPHVVVHLESGDEVVILEGAVERVTDRAQLERVGSAYAEKYGWGPGADELAAGTWYALRPELAFTWSEERFPTTAVRWRFGG